MVKVFKAPNPFFRKSDTPTIERKDEPFIERIIKYGLSISKTAESTGAAATIYTVPSGKRFFLTNYSISAIQTSGVGNGTISLYVDSTANTLATIYVATSSTDTQTYPLSTPLLLNSGEKLIIDVILGSVTSSGSVSGYEIEPIYLK